MDNGHVQAFEACSVGARRRRVSGTAGRSSLKTSSSSRTEVRVRPGCLSPCETTRSECTPRAGVRGAKRAFLHPHCQLQ
eukprot:5290376-Pleurochrysis_carterae.AAC.1